MVHVYGYAEFTTEATDTIKAKMKQVDILISKHQVLQIFGASLSKPHLYVKCKFCLSVCLSVCRSVHS